LGLKAAGIARSTDDDQLTGFPGIRPL